MPARLVGGRKTIPPNVESPHEKERGQGKAHPIGGSCLCWPKWSSQETCSVSHLHRREHVLMIVLNHQGVDLSFFPLTFESIFMCGLGSWESLRA